jgi:hypothetical protein
MLHTFNSKNKPQGNNPYYYYYYSGQPGRYSNLFDHTVNDIIL